jgi:hypothetical protein
MSLVKWHRRLHDRFTHLHAARSTGWPVFALEHGLTTDDRADLVEAVRVDARRGSPTRDAWLPYLVYAAELAYDFDGDEYWQSFEYETPGWSGTNIRYWLRERYQTFADTYGGIRPRGAWAEHFSVMCWPIFNAVLPVDLQHHLLRVLDRLSPRFGELLTSPEVLGSAIASHSLWSDSTRFKDFCGDPSLVGHVALALLWHDRIAGQALLDSTVLRRLVDDLKRRHQAGALFTKVSRRSRQVRGLVLQVRRTAITARSEIGADRPAPERLAPRLELKPEGTDGWALYMVPPSLVELSQSASSVERFLTATRVRIPAAVNSRWERGDWLLWGRSSVRLARLPEPGVPVIEFEDPPPVTLDARLRFETIVHVSRILVFKRRSDGTAIQLAQPVVNTSDEYFLASRTPLPSNGPWKLVPTACDGLHLGSLNLDPNRSEPGRTTLTALGIDEARS